MTRASFLGAAGAVVMIALFMVARATGDDRWLAPMVLAAFIALLGMSASFFRKLRSFRTDKQDSRNESPWE